MPDAFHSSVLISAAYIFVILQLLGRNTPWPGWLSEADILTEKTNKTIKPQNGENTLFGQC